MAFSDGFAGPVGQKLGAREGWTLALGQDCLSIGSSGRLTKADTTAARNLYLTADETGSQVAKVDLGVTNGAGLVVLASVSGGLANCYYLKLTTATNIRLYRYTGGTTKGYSNITVADGLDAELRATVFSDRVEIGIYSHGSLVGTVTDTDAGRFTTGRRGLLTDTTGSFGTGYIGPYQDNTTAFAGPGAGGSAGSYVTIAPETVKTLTKAQLATLRVKDVARTAGTVTEPLAIRWRRPSTPAEQRDDGLNAKVTVS